MSLLIPVCFVVVGALLYVVTPGQHGKIGEIGRLVFFAAFLALMFGFSSNSIRFLVD